MATIQQFIKSAGLSMKAERTDHNPSMDDSANMDHWRCVIRAGRSRMTIVFSQGYGHNGAEPKLSSVLDCLASDASGYDNAQSFEDWCSEYGYDSDSRKAERTFKVVEKQARKLRSLLGDSAYDTLLWHIDRE